LETTTEKEKEMYEQEFNKRTDEVHLDGDDYYVEETASSTKKEKPKQVENREVEVGIDPFAESEEVVKMDEKREKERKENKKDDMFNFPMDMFDNEKKEELKQEPKKKKIDKLTIKV